MVCVFARKTSEPLTSLVKQLDSKIGENNKIKSFVVLLSQDKDKASEQLKKLAADGGIKNVPLTVHSDPAEAPDYELSKEADVTVVMWSGVKVKATRGYKGELSTENIQEILSDLPKVLDK